ncbi:MAG: hypothetical protein ACLP4V_06965 [Methylocella sp.]
MAYDQGYKSCAKIKKNTKCLNHCPDGSFGENGDFAHFRSKWLNATMPVGVTVRSLSKHGLYDPAAAGVACGVWFVKFDVEENAGHEHPFSKLDCCSSPLSIGASNFVQPRFEKPPHVDA